MKLKRANGAKLAKVRSFGRLRIGARGKLISHHYHSFLNKRQSKRVLRYSSKADCRGQLEAKRQITVKSQIKQVLFQTDFAASMSSSDDRSIKGANPPLFRAPITTSSGGSISTGIEINRFTKLPIPDVAVSNRMQNSVSVLLGTGTGSFAQAPESPIDLGQGARSLETGDVNSDGNPDLIAGIAAGGLKVLLGKDDGTFTTSPAASPTISPLPTAIAMGNLNGDGKPDLAITHRVPSNELPKNLDILLGDGKGGFSHAPGSPMSGGDAPSGIAIGRFTSFEKNDLAVPTYETAGFGVMLGTGTGGFAPGPGSPFAAGDSPGAVALADLNSDGNQDAAIANQFGTSVSVLYGDGSGNFSPAPKDLTVGSQPSAILIRDLNGDKELDMATANAKRGDISVLLGDGTGKFTAADGSPYAAGTLPLYIASGDLNGDNRPDLATVTRSGTVSVLLNNG
ncbi:MAG: VCBS repeat-containing protein [Thermoleophilia bacterium]|nr:VCBS repeat-containing protein [Thermoleophilia bacterium]